MGARARDGRFRQVGGCAGNSGTTGDDGSLARQMFVAGFEDIDAVYIDEPKIDDLALAGLQQLSTIDSDVTARRSADRIELMLKNQVAYSASVDDDFDAHFLPWQAVRSAGAHDFDVMAVDDDDVVILKIR